MKKVVLLAFHIPVITCFVLLDKEDDNEYKKLWKNEKPLWLEEYEQGVTLDRHYSALHDHLMLGDDPGFGKRMDAPSARIRPNMACPQVHIKKGLEACLAPQCDIDEDCIVPEKCCNNGCVQTCLAGEPMPALVDWESQPQGLILGSNHWLVSDPRRELLGQVRHRLDSHSITGCVFKDSVIPEGTQFEYESRPCECKSGEIDCYVKPNAL